MTAHAFVGCMSRLVVSRHSVDCAKLQTTSCIGRLHALRAPAIWQISHNLSNNNGSRSYVHGHPRRTFAAQAAGGASGLVEQIKEKNAKTPVIVYSKTYCPYCAEVKSLFKNLKVEHTVIELDDLADGADVQDALKTVTQRGTVPQVFVANKFVGGCDDTLAAFKSGKLKTMFEEAGIVAQL